MHRENLGRAQDAADLQPISLDVLREKYLKNGETGVGELYARVARALASVEPEARRAECEALFLANLQAGAIGAGRIMSAAGTDLQATLINCFVQPVGDCIQGVDDGGYPGIYEALREAAETMRCGGGVGYDFSRIRPRGAEVRATASLASGPCSYINVFDQSCATVESAGARRGAQMGVLRIDHPDVLEFITAKRTPGRWNNFNVSVGVSDAFMQAVAEDQPWHLVHRARPGAALLEQGAHQRGDGQWVYQTLPARTLWDTIMRSAYDFAEPGILFLDHINDDNNLRYCEEIAATNPCVTADTWVLTESGPAQVADLVGKTFGAVVDGQVYATESAGFFATGRKPVLRLTTREGQVLRLTADHLVRRVARRTRYALQAEWTPAAPTAGRRRGTAAQPPCVSRLGWAGHRGRRLPVGPADRRWNPQGRQGRDQRMGARAAPGRRQRRQCGGLCRHGRGRHHAGRRGCSSQLAPPRGFPWIPAASGGTWRGAHGQCRIARSGAWHGDGARAQVHHQVHGSGLFCIFRRAAARPV